MQTETTNNSTIKTTLRWIAFVPAAVAAAFIGHFLMRLFNLLGHFLMRLFNLLGSSRYGDDSWWSYLVGEFLANGAFGAAFVYAGCYVVPAQKKVLGLHSLRSFFFFQELHFSSIFL